MSAARFFREYGISCISRGKSGEADERKKISRNNSFPDGVEDNFGGTVQVQLLHDPRPMSLDRVGTEVEHACDFLIRLAFGQELQDLFLPDREQIVGVLEAALLQLAHVVFKQRIGDCGAEKRLALCDGANSVVKVHVRALLQ